MYWKDYLLVMVLSLLAATASAEGMAGAMHKDAMPMMEQRMNQALERARQATDPVTRRQAMKEHMLAMQRMMQGMNQMMGNGDQSKDCAGHDPGMQMKKDKRGMMHRHMWMMQQMMSHMLAHEAMEQEEEQGHEPGH